MAIPIKEKIEELANKMNEVREQPQNAELIKEVQAEFKKLNLYLSGVNGRYESDQKELRVIGFKREDSNNVDTQTGPKKNLDGTDGLWLKAIAEREKIINDRLPKYEEILNIIDGKSEHLSTVKEYVNEIKEIVAPKKEEEIEDTIDQEEKEEIEDTIDQEEKEEIEDTIDQEEKEEIEDTIDQEEKEEIEDTVDKEEIQGKVNSKNKGDDFSYIHVPKKDFEKANNTESISLEDYLKTVEEQIKDSEPHFAYENVEDVEKSKTEKRLVKQNKVQRMFKKITEEIRKFGNKIKNGFRKKESFDKPMDTHVVEFPQFPERIKHKVDNNILESEEENTKEENEKGFEIAE